MEISDIKSKLIDVLSINQILCDEPLKKHTTFRIGGNTPLLIQPSSLEELTKSLEIIGDFPHIVIGNGSNILFHDEGYEGIVVKICGFLSRIEVADNIIVAQSGALLSRIGNIALDNSLSGFEFAAQIPGTIGGGVSMNAGAYGGEMKDVVVETSYIDGNGKSGVTTDHQFGYRHSIYTGTDKIITSVKISLQKGDKAEIREKMHDLLQRRKDKQPLEYPSAGSTFKRPEGYFAGKLIEQAGLRGYTFGGAAVSEKHCGFVINKDNATFSDVMHVIEHIEQKVYEQFGVELEPEVKII